jgi:hypothetical protein
VLLLLQSAHACAAAVSAHLNLTAAVHSPHLLHAAAAAVRSLAAIQGLVLLVLPLLMLQDSHQQVAALQSLLH